MSKLKPPLRRGSVVGERWRVGRPLAVGGFAVVYEASDIESGDAAVVKALRGDACDADHVAVERFEREARVAIQFEHPHVVRTLAHGRADNGVPWIAMERLQGQTLTRTMYQEPLPIDRVRNILIQILSDWVHRDLKPSNVYLCRPEQESQTPDDDIVKLLDFGFVKVLDSTSPLAAPLTMMGQSIGTPGYMAPEMLDGGGVTHLCDLYAVGILGHELLAGEQAFAGEGIQRAMAQMRTEPDPLPEPAASHEISEIIGRLHARKPKARYQSARDAIAALREASEAPEPRKKRRWFRLWR